MILQLGDLYESEFIPEVRSFRIDQLLSYFNDGYYDITNVMKRVSFYYFYYNWKSFVLKGLTVVKNWFETIETFPADTTMLGHSIKVSFQQPREKLLGDIRVSQDPRWILLHLQLRD